MASWNAVYQGLRGQVITALDGLVPASSITIGYPGTPIVQSSGQPSEVMALANQVSQSPMVMLYDRGMSRDVTRWIPRYVTAWETISPAITFSLPDTVLGTDPLQLDFLSDAAANDAVGLNLSGFGLNTGAVFTASGGMSAASFASGITSVIEQDLNGVVSATVSGSSVTLQNQTTAPINLMINAANLGTALFEVHRVQRSVQVIALANRPSHLDLVGEPLAQLFGALEVYFGYELSDETWVRLINKGDIVLWDNVMHNIARRDWMLTLEYGVNLVDMGYPVLAPILAQSVLANGLS